MKSRSIPLPYYSLFPCLDLLSEYSFHPIQPFHALPFIAVKIEAQLSNASVIAAETASTPLSARLNPNKRNLYMINDPTNIIHEALIRLTLQHPSLSHEPEHMIIYRRDLTNSEKRT